LGGEEVDVGGRLAMMKLWKRREEGGGGGGMLVN